MQRERKTKTFSDHMIRLKQDFISVYRNVTRVCVVSVARNIPQVVRGVRGNVGLLEHTIQLSRNLFLSSACMPQDELCLLSPTFAPLFFYVGKLSIDVPLAWDLSRPVKISVSDVLGVVRVRDHHESMTAEVSERDLVSCGMWDHRGKTNVGVRPITSC